jgi:hypothetical protein
MKRTWSGNDDGMSGLEVAPLRATSRQERGPTNEFERRSNSVIDLVTPSPEKKPQKGNIGRSKEDMGT